MELDQGMIVDIEKRGEVIPNTLFLYINLDRSLERRTRMETMLQGLDVTFARVPGIDGHLAFQDYPDRDKSRFLKCHGRHMRPGELGCYRSHLKAMCAFLETDYDFAVIMEDDAEFVDNIKKLEAVFLSDHAKKWDFLRLQSRRRFQFLPIEQLNDDYFFAVNLTRSTGATAYALNRVGAEALLRCLEQINVPFDHAFDRPQAFNIRYRHLMPDIITPAGHESTIELTRPKRGGAFYRATTLWWRARTEVMRFSWSVKEYLLMRLRGPR